MSFSYRKLSPDTIELMWASHCDKDLVIPSEIDGFKVVSIGESAFNKKGINSVVLPNTIETIRSYAFADNEISSVILPESLLEIEECAFRGNKISSVKIPDSVTKIGYNSFEVFFTFKWVADIVHSKHKIEVVEGFPVIINSERQEEDYTVCEATLFNLGHKVFVVKSGLLKAGSTSYQQAIKKLKLAEKFFKNVPEKFNSLQDKLLIQAVGEQYIKHNLIN